MPACLITKTKRNDTERYKQAYLCTRNSHVLSNVYIFDNSMNLRNENAQKERKRTTPLQINMTIQRHRKTTKIISVLYNLIEIKSPCHASLTRIWQLSVSSTSRRSSIDCKLMMLRIMKRTYASLMIHTSIQIWRLKLNWFVYQKQKVECDVVREAKTKDHLPLHSI